MSTTQMSESNAMSEYEFPDISDDNSIEQEETSYSVAVQRMDPNVRLVLRNFQLDNIVLERFAERDVKFSQLAALSNEDLELFGVTDRLRQDEMIQAFESLQNQSPHLELALNNLRDQRYPAAKQEMSVIDLIQDQLLGLNTILAATIIKVGAAQSSSSPGVVINSNFNPPKVVLNMLHKMTLRTNEMTDLIRQLQNQHDLDEKKDEMEKQSKKKFMFTSLLLASGIIIGFFVAKKLRGGKLFF